MKKSDIKPVWTPKIAPVYLITASTLLAIAISIISLMNGCFIIFQNFFYIPIVIACIYYGKKGFFFSILISAIYFILISVFTQNPEIIYDALIRVCIFIFIAGVTTYLSIKQKCTEEELTNAEQKLDDIIEFLPDPIFLIDTDKRVIAWNRAMEKVAGIPKDDIVGKGDSAYSEAIYGNKKPVLIDAVISGDILDSRYKNLKKEGDTVSAEIHFDSENEKDITDFRVTASPFYDTNGKVIGAVEYIHDITELKRNETVLRENEAYLRTLIRTIPDLVWLKDEKGVFISCNKMFERFFGATEEEIKGKTDYDFLDHELADFFRENDRRAVEAGGPTTNEEWITFADDGHRACLETIKTPMYDSDGKLIGVLGIGRDITLRKEMEDALRESEAKLMILNKDLNTIFENAPAMIFYKDTKNKFIRVNPKVAEKFGLPVEDIVGRSGRDLFPHYKDAYYEDDLKIINSGEPEFGIIESFITAKGKKLWISMDKIPLKDQNGEVYGVLLFATDITEQKKNQDALKEVNRKLNLLSSITRHDILNQITVAAGYLDLIEMDQNIPKETKTEEYINKITNAVETIKRQITFTGYYKDLGEQSPQWFDVGEIIEKISTSSAFVSDIKSIKFTNNIENIEVFADPLFEKVIYNLTDNAIKHGETITEITFYSEQKPDELIIYCEDDGVGIPGDVKEKIFRREYFKNSGLGLFLSREILSITGLTITETGTPGEGARFEIHIPEGKFRAK
ncbi:multi-sensor signal transduction histidine kinase [Methanolacinia petrolearia DSM 11571]|uniref:histidine kinase n=1 Tax=Methanolacinia petrolearia (strain DSM 11571 / OCM 486 / SEBR 4847) TaxID=679926 RepID=E1RCX4_METP4|nr:PAS domain S-box protein [Methanolacinia petrolearia]ADN35874.1 multi-sensor signal transduction histidine kinase [Methanolacinia petrolearia DSM 11571]